MRAVQASLALLRHVGATGAQADSAPIAPTCLRAKLRRGRATIARKYALAQAAGSVAAQGWARHRSTVGLCPSGAHTPEPGHRSSGPRKGEAPEGP